MSTIKNVESIITEGKEKTIFCIIPSENIDVDYEIYRINQRTCYYLESYLKDNLRNSKEINIEISVSVKK